MSIQTVTEQRNIVDAIHQYLKEEDYNFRQTNDENPVVINISFKWKNATYESYMEIWEDARTFIFYTYIENEVSEHKKQAMAEFLTRANFGARLGNFEMYFSDGRIRYKTSINVEDGELTSKMIDTIIFANINIVDDYYPGIMSVLYAGISPEEAINKIENTEDPSNN